MEILAEKVGDVRVLRLRGRMDLEAAPAFESAMAGYTGSGETRFVIDCQELKYVSSSGLGSFIACGQKLAGGGAMLFAGLSQHLESLFTLTGIAGLFPVCRNREDALEKLGVPGT